MSYGTIYNDMLYVFCNDILHAKALIAKFESDNPFNEEFEVWRHESTPDTVYFDLTCHDAGRSLNDNIEKLAQWLKANLGLFLEGHWNLDCDDGEFRGEVHNGKVYESNLGWLKSHTVEEIELIRRWSEEHFPQESFYTPQKPLEECKISAESPAKLNAGYVYTALQVTCRNQKQAESLVQKFNQEFCDGKFYSKRVHPTSKMITFLLTNPQTTESVRNEICELDQWLKANFKLRLSGYWYRDSEDEFYRCEISKGEIIEPLLDWLLDYFAAEIDQIKYWAEDHFPHPSHLPAPLADSDSPLPDTPPGKTFENAYIRVSVYCRGKEQMQALCKKFEIDKPGFGMFTLQALTNDFPYQIYFESNDNPASCSLDESILHLHQWLQHNFDLQLGGFWQQYYPRLCRGEVHYGRILKRHLGWLVEYSNNEQEQISNWARNRFYPDDEDTSSLEEN